MQNVWWHCKKCGNEWKSVINARVKGTVCPVCAERAVLSGYNDLATTDSDLLSEWDYELNNLKPTVVSRNSAKRAWWKCRYGHSWSMKIVERTVLGKGCRECEQEYWSLFPAFAISYYAKMKGLKIELGSDRLLGIPIDVYIPSEQVAIEVNLGSEKIETLKEHLCKQRDVKLIRLPIKENETETEYAQRIKAAFQSVHIFIYLKSSGSFEAAEEDERDTIVCDENGFAQTKDMPYGVYTVHQTKGWEGRELMKDFDVFISQDGQTYHYLINNANFESYIKVVKIDAETGKTIPYAGAGFQIYDPAGNKLSMTFTYPTPTTIDTFYTDADGQLVTPEKLEYGKGYSLVEVQAPYGYVLDSTPVSFDVTEENSTQEGGITLIKVDKPNMAQKGTISIEKTGEVFFGVNVFGEKDKDVIYQPVYTVKGLAGAVYELTADEDVITPDGTLRYHKGDVVDTVTTDEDGFAKSKELYLGKYTVVETKAPTGMVINKEKHSVELTYAGQDVAVTEIATSFVNERQKVKISLGKILEQDETFGIGKNDEIKNVSFGLYAKEDIVSSSGTVIPADGLIEIITLDENGTAIANVQAFFLRSFISLCGSAPSVINIAYSVVCVIHHKFVSCRNGGFEVIFFKAIGIYYRIEQLLIIYIERQVRDNEIVIYVRILLFDFINTTTT